MPKTSSNRGDSFLAARHPWLEIHRPRISPIAWIAKSRNDHRIDASTVKVTASALPARSRPISTKRQRVNPRPSQQSKTTHIRTGCLTAAFHELLPQYTSQHLIKFRRRHPRTLRSGKPGQRFRPRILRRHPTGSSFSNNDARQPDSRLVQNRNRCLSNTLLTVRLNRLHFNPQSPNRIRHRRLRCR